MTIGAAQDATYELYAIRYATRAGQRRDHFMGGDPHEGSMPMDYFLWAAVSSERSFVIDAGFTEEVAARRGRTFLRCPIEALRLVGVDPDKVEDVILTHRPISRRESSCAPREAIRPACSSSRSIRDEGQS